MKTGVVEQGGDYFWVVQDNQPTLRADIALLFAEPPWGEELATAGECGRHGDRWEERTLWTSTALNEYLDWPQVRQVCCVERKVTRKGARTIAKLAREVYKDKVGKRDGRCVDMEAAESLFECLEQVPDPRMARGVRHPFQAILRLTLLGLVCGQTTMAHIALFARMNWPALKEPLGFLRDHPPHATTISRTLAGCLASAVCSRP